jgi:hypothetical protein
MGRENIKIPVYSKVGIRPPKLIYPRTDYCVPKFISDEEYNGKSIVCFERNIIFELQKTLNNMFTSPVKS